MAARTTPIPLLALLCLTGTARATEGTGKAKWKPVEASHGLAGWVQRPLATDSPPQGGRRGADRAGTPPAARRKGAPSHAGRAARPGARGEESPEAPIAIQRKPEAVCRLTLRAERPTEEGLAPAKTRCTVEQRDPRGQFSAVKNASFLLDRPTRCLGFIPSKEEASQDLCVLAEAGKEQAPGVTTAAFEDGPRVHVVDLAQGHHWAFLGEVTELVERGEDQHDTLQLALPVAKPQGRGPSPPPAWDIPVPLFRKPPNPEATQVALPNQLDPLHTGSGEVTEGVRRYLRLMAAMPAFFAEINTTSYSPAARAAATKRGDRNLRTVAQLLGLLALEGTARGAWQRLKAIRKDQGADTLSLDRVYGSTFQQALLEAAAYYARRGLDDARPPLSRPPFLVPGVETKQTTWLQRFLDALKPKRGKEALDGETPRDSSLLEGLAKIVARAEEERSLQAIHADATLAKALGIHKRVLEALLVDRRADNPLNDLAQMLYQQNEERAQRRSSSRKEKARGATLAARTTDDLKTEAARLRDWAAGLKGAETALAERQAELARLYDQTSGRLPEPGSAEAVAAAAAGKLGDQLSALGGKRQAVLKKLETIEDALKARGDEG